MKNSPEGVTVGRSGFAYSFIPIALDHHGENAGIAGPAGLCERPMVEIDQSSRVVSMRIVLS